MDNPPDDGPCEVTITAPDREWLERFVRQIVEDRLAAAAHVDVMQTTYRWNDKVHVGQEARARLHTMQSRVGLIVGRTRRTHVYEVPCVVSIALGEGDPEYLAWVAAESLGKTTT